MFDEQSGRLCHLVIYELRKYLNLAEVDHYSQWK